MDIILSFLAKPVDKHGITLVHITYPPLRTPSRLGNLPSTPLYGLKNGIAHADFGCHYKSKQINVPPMCLMDN